MHSIPLATAKLVLDAAFEAAEGRGVRNAAVVVVDNGGNIRAAQRSDSWGAFGVDIALAKARTALGFNTASIKIGAVFKDNPSGAVGVNAAVGGRFITLGGGVLVTDAQGDTIGAAGFSGAAPEVDHDIIVTAVRAAGLVTPD